MLLIDKSILQIILASYDGYADPELLPLSIIQISRRPKKALVKVISSAYSNSPPTGRP